MKMIKYFIPVVALLAWVQTASAISSPLNITVYNGANVIAAPDSAIANYGDTVVYNWLTANISSYNTLNSASLPTLVINPYLSKTSGTFPSGPQSISLNGADYIFLHWGGQGGGWLQAYYTAGLTGNFSFAPPPGNPPTVGGLSFYSVYGARVPDGGSTALLLGSALAGLGLIRRKLSA